MECDICLEQRKNFVVCYTCKKEWCTSCYDRMKKPLIKWERKQYYVSTCPYCRRNYLWGSSLLGINTVQYRLDRSKTCLIQ